MNDASALPLVVVFGIVTVLLVRSREVKAWQATVMFLFGVYAALTPVVFTVVALVSWFVGLFT